MSATNWRIPGNFEDWMRTMEKRMTSLERRPVVTTPQDLMGPSLGPWAVTMTNLNSDEAAANGMWYLPPDAENGPDPAWGWLGWTVAQTYYWGLQVAIQAHDTSGALATGSGAQIRRFLIPSGEVGRIYGSWGPL